MKINNEDVLISEENENLTYEVNEESNNNSNVSLWVGIFLAGKMAITVTGFSLPQTFLSMSFTWGIFFIIVYAFFNWWSFNLLALICDKLKIYDYSKLVDIILGGHWVKLYNFSVWLSCFIAMIVYNNISKFFSIIELILYNTAFFFYFFSLFSF